jgi:hypothetical protein
VSEACALVVRAGRLLIVQRGRGGLWEGFWEFPDDPPGRRRPGRAQPRRAVDLAEGVRRLTGVRARIGPAVRTVRFGVTKHRVTLTAHAAADLGGEPSPGPGLARALWATPAELHDYPFGSVRPPPAPWPRMAVSDGRCPVSGRQPGK